MKRILIAGLVVLGLAGLACKSSTTPPVETPPTITSFTANPTTVHAGETSTLSWSVSHATSVSIDQGIGAVSATSGTRTVTPTVTTTYTLTATNADGTRTATCTVTYAATLPTVDSFTATPAAILLGGTSTLAWSVQNATTVSIDNGIGTVGATGTHDVSPTVATTYTLTATNADGDDTATVEVTIKPAAALTFSFDPNPPVWTYEGGVTSSTFSEILTEVNGVGGNAYSAFTGLYLLPDPTTRIGSHNFGGGDFAANGTLTLGPATLSGTGQATVFAIVVDGTDDSGYVLEEEYYGTISWVGAVGTAQIQKAVPGQTDPRIMRLLDDLKTRKR